MSISNCKNPARLSVRTVLRLVIPALAVLTAVFLAVACTPESPQNGTDTDADTGETGAAPMTDAGSGPESDTVVPANGTEADSETVAATETETEPETEVPMEKPTDPTVVTYWQGDGKSMLDCISASGGAVAEKVSDGVYGPVVCLYTDMGGQAKAKPAIRFDYQAYMDMLGLTPVPYGRCAVIGMRVRTENAVTRECNLRTFSSAGSRGPRSNVNSAYAEGDGWQEILFFVNAEKSDDSLGVLQFSFFSSVSSADERVYIESIHIFTDVTEACAFGYYDAAKPQYTTLEIKGLTRPYKIIHITDAHACAFTDEEYAAMSADRATYLAGRVTGFSVDGMTSAQRFLMLMKWADKQDADLILMTGDVVDFPSEGNIALLHGAVASSKTPVLYMLGNHDWAFADDYQTPNAKANNIPRFDDISDNNAAIHYLEYEDLIIAAMDNSTNYYDGEAAVAFRSLTEKGKPVILTAHVPFYEQTLTGPSARTWGYDICLGPGALASTDPTVLALYNLCATEENTNVAAVIAGHLHFNHEGTFPNGVPQIVTGAANDGTVRVITLVPAE